MKSEQFLRLTAPGLIFGKGTDGRVEVIERTTDDEGNVAESVVCDLSRFVMGQLARCRVDLLMKDVTVEVDIERFLVQTFKPRRRTLHALHRIGDLTWRVREWVRRGDIVDVTAFGTEARTYRKRWSA